MEQAFHLVQPAVHSNDIVMEQAVHNHLLSLPPELLLPILQFLPHQSLCQVVLTCKHLHQVGCDPDLWADLTINKIKVRDDGIADLFKIPRFSNLKHLNLADVGVENGLFLTLDDLVEVLLYVNARANDGNNLESLDLQWARKLCNVPTELASTALLRVQKLKLKNSSISSSQLVALFEQLPLSKTLQELNMDQVDLDRVSSQLLAEAICSLRRASLDSCSLTPEQCVALFSRSLSSTSLEELNIYNSSVREVPSQLLNPAICRLKRVNLGYCLGGGFSGEREANDLQMTSLFTAMASSTSLEFIQFWNADMSQIDPVIMARGVCHVASVELKFVKLTVSHLDEIVKCKMNEDDTLKDLDVSENDFSDLTNCWHLGQALARMRIVNLEMTGLNSRQVIVILRAIQKLSVEESALKRDATVPILEELYLLDNPEKGFDGYCFVNSECKSTEICFRRCRSL